MASRKIIQRNFQSPGDIVMLTAAVREIHRPLSAPLYHLKLQEWVLGAPLQVSEMETSKKRWLQGTAGLVGLCGLLIGFLAASHKHIEVRFGESDSLEIRPASLIEATLRGKCSVDIRTSSNRKAHIELYQDMSNSPVLVIPAKEAGIFVCIYDYDVDFQLLRINMNQPFDPKPGEGFVKSNVLSSTCKVERIGTNEDLDWSTVKDALMQMPRSAYRQQAIGCDFLQTDQQTLLDAIRNHGNQGVYGSTF